MSSWSPTLRICRRFSGRALRTAVGSRGVAVVVLPGDVALQPLDARPPAWSAPTEPLVRPRDEELDRLATLLNAASRVTLLCGAGCAGAHAEVVALAERLQSPIVHALRGKEHVEYDNPYDVGMTGLIGFASGYAAMKACDTLLMLGTDFPYRQFYPRAGARGADRLGGPKRWAIAARSTLGLVGDVKETLAALLAG